MNGGTDPLPHGGRLEAAARIYPEAPRPFIDLSTGINPVSYPIPVMPDNCFTRWPEPEALWRLSEAAAAAYAVVDPSLIIAAPGTQALISLLPYLRRTGRVSGLAPTYGEHEAAWAAAGHSVRLVDNPESLANAEVAVLCNPNNPDGRRHPLALLLNVAEHLAARDGWLVVDEAFADFEPDVESLAKGAPPPGVVVLRSFGKTYGLAGVRLGFAIAEATIAARIKSALGPWAVSGVAIAIGALALGDVSWRAAAAARLAADAARLDGMLLAAGFRVLGGTRLYRFCAVPDGAAAAHRLGQAGILVRAFEHQPKRLRFGIPAGAGAWQRLGNALST